MTQSHIEFQAAHQARVTAIATARQIDLDRAAQIRSAAESVFTAANEAELKAHEEARHERMAAFQLSAATTYDPIVRDYLIEPSRANVGKLAEALIAVEAEAWQQCGLDAGRHNSGCGLELQHALIAPRIATASPEAAQRLAYHGNGHIGGLSVSYRRAVEALRERDVIAAGQHLLEVESALSAVARTGSRGGGDGAERFALIRFGGLAERRDAALAKLERSAFEAENGTDAERQMRASAMEKATTRRNEGESVGDAFRRFVNEIQDQAKALIAEVATPAPTSSKKPKPRASATADAAAEDEELQAEVASFRLSDGSPVTI